MAPPSACSRVEYAFAKHIGLRTGITLAVLLATLVTGGAVIAAILWTVEGAARDTARQQFMSEAGDKAVRTREMLTRGLVLTRTVVSYAAAVAENRGANSQRQHERNRRFLYRVLTENSEFDAAWFAFEPGIIDNVRDEGVEGANPDGSGPYDRGGYYMPCYHRRANGSVVYAPPPKDDKPALENDWYSVPAQRGRETLTEPAYYAYDGNPENRAWVFAGNAPIIARIDGPDKPERLVGVGGMDWGVGELQSFFDAIDAEVSYPNAVVLLFAQNGHCVAHSRGGLTDAFLTPHSHAGGGSGEEAARLDAAAPAWLSQAVLRPGTAPVPDQPGLAALPPDNDGQGSFGMFRTADGGRIACVVKRLSPGHSGQPWTFVLAAPEAELMAPLHDLRRLAAYASCIALFFALLFALVIARFAGRAVLRRNRLYETILDLLPAPVAFRDVDRRWVVVNQTVERLTGVSRRDVLGRTEPESGQAPPLFNAISRPAGELTRDPASHRTFAFGDRHYEADTYLLETGAGECRGYLDVARDVTDRTLLATALREVTCTASGMASDADAIGQSGRDFADRAREQVEAIDQVRKSLNLIDEHARANSAAAATGRQLAVQVRDAARDGMAEAGHTAAAIGGVTEAGLRVAQVAKLIDDIAFQTNLLSLNAAVEAARAGRQGKGFAVVAGEVRDLSSRSARAARDASDMIAEMTRKIGESSDIVHRLENALRRIDDASERQTEISGVIADATTRQSDNVSAVLRELERMADLNSRAGENARESAESANRLGRRAIDLRALMASLALADADVPAGMKQKERVPSHDAVPSLA